MKSALITGLVFELIVLALMLLPPMPVRAQHAPQFVYCDQGMCAMTEKDFDRLLELAKKAGKTCL